VVGMRWGGDRDEKFISTAKSKDAQIDLNLIKVRHENEIYYYFASST
jgi:hypothetical protein